ACSSDRQCLAWTYVRPGVEGPQGQCRLKDTVSHAAANPSCVSGVTRELDAAHRPIKKPAATGPAKSLGGLTAKPEAAPTPIAPAPKTPEIQAAPAAPAVEANAVPQAEPIPDLSVPAKPAEAPDAAAAPLPEPAVEAKAASDNEPSVAVAPVVDAAPVIDTAPVTEPSPVVAAAAPLPGQTDAALPAPQEATQLAQVPAADRPRARRYGPTLPFFSRKNPTTLSARGGQTVTPANAGMVQARADGPPLFIAPDW
ncbi:MAG: PAN domain-containing protein, partial [Pseudomonadota bacterium]